MVDQTIRGRQFLKKNFGPDAVPRGTRQIDPVGHSNTQAWLLGAENWYGAGPAEAEIDIFELEEWGTFMFFHEIGSGSRNHDYEKLAILGSIRGRRGAALKVLSAAETKVPGYFDKIRNDVLRDRGRDESGTWGADAMTFTRSPARRASTSWRAAAQRRYWRTSCCWRPSPL